MLENNLLKTNFLGRDGFRWWIGQIPPVESWTLQYRKRQKSWGNRVKVRIMGYHPQNTVELPDEELPWAMVLLSPQCGSGGAGKGKPIRIKQGDVVVGFFLDGDDAQQPVIFGVIGRSSYVVSGEPGPFKPFSGYTDDEKPEGNVIVGNETNSDEQSSQTSSRLVDKETAQKISDISGKEVKSSSGGVGTDVPFAGTDSKKTNNVILENAVKDSKDASPQKKKEILANASKAITNNMNQVVGDGVKSGLKDFVPVAKKGIQQKGDMTFKAVLAATKNNSIAFRAAQAVESSFIGKIKNIQDKIPCVAQKVAGSMLPDVEQLLTSFLDNVSNFTSCIGDQFTGAIFNKVVNGIDDVLGPDLGGLGSILGGFDMISNLRGKVDALAGLQDVVDCVTNQDPSDESNIWTLGKGAKNLPAISASSILNVANAAQALSEAAGAPGGIAGGLLGSFDFLNPGVSTQGFSSILGECYTGPPLDCIGVDINVFGADGKGVIATPIIGAIVGDNEIAGTIARKTGSLIGVNIKEPGSGFTVPPIVTVTDKCNNGYGAHARAVIDYDPQSPTYQQVTDIYVVTPGENYPVIEDENDYTVDHVVVVNSGAGYSNDDVITDNQGNVYTKILDESGRILNVIPPNPALENVKLVSNLPILNIETSTGSGAIIKAQLAPRPSYQGEIKQVIDCITPRDGIVGFINGDPYYGPFHIHPDRGVKMVGAAHTTTPHAIIYDTPAESRSVNAVTTSSSTTMTTVSSPSAAPYTPPETVAPTTDTSQTMTQPTTPPPSSPPPSSPPSSSPPSSPPPSSGGGGYGY